MTFHWPLLLWFMALPALWLAIDLARLRRHKSTTAASPSKIIQAEATRSSLRLSPLASSPSPSSKPRWRFCLGLAAAIIALARPQWGRIEEPVFDQSREILLALDLSRSMTAPDVKPTRLDRAKLLITSLLERLEGERVGLVVFAGTSFLQSPLSADYEILRDFLPALSPDFLPQGGSNYRALLETSLDAFGSDAVADRYLIVLSDGEATDDNWKPLAEQLKKKSIRVIGLGIGTPAGAMLPDGAGGFVKDERGAVVLSKLESGTLQQLAEITGGTYTDASSWVDLAQLITNTVEAGRKGAFMERNRVRLAERFQWALAPALLLFAWSFWREFPVRPRSRDIQLKTKNTPSPLPSVGGARPPSRMTVANLLILALALAPLLTAHGSFAAETSSAAASPDPTATIAQPLSTLVGHLSTRDTLAARDHAELARTTVTYGERLQSAKHPVPEGPIHDALLAVDQGEAADAKAADWPDLRAKLKKFLEKSEPPPKQDEQKKEDEKKDQQEKKEKQESKDQSGQSDQEKSDPQKSDSEKSQNSQSQKNQQSQPQDSKDAKPGEEKKEPPKEQPSAFGDMQKPPEPKPAEQAPQPAAPEETQKIGGAPEDKSTTPANPELSVPLQKLDQVRDLDSPGRLFQLMQDPKAKPEKSGKDW